MPGGHIFFLLRRILQRRQLLDIPIPAGMKEHNKEKQVYAPVSFQNNIKIKPFPA